MFFFFQWNRLVNFIYKDQISIIYINRQHEVLHFIFIKMYLFLLFLSFIVSVQSGFNLYCPNGRPALWSFDIFTLNFSTYCSSPGQSCLNKIGRCNDQHLCCPRTLR